MALLAEGRTGACVAPSGRGAEPLVVDAAALGAGTAEDEPAGAPVGDALATGDEDVLDVVGAPLEPEAVADDEPAVGVDCEVGAGSGDVAVGSGDGDEAVGSGDGEGDVLVGCGAGASMVNATARFPATLPSSSLCWTATM